jgi:hypothetical protein
MTTSCFPVVQAVFAATSTRIFKLAWPSGWMVLVLLLMNWSSARAEEPDAKYLRIYRVIEQADSLSKSGQTEPAKARYQEAQTSLRDLKRIYPTWNAKAVAYRLSYVSERIDGLSQPAAPAVTAVAGTKSEDNSGTPPANVQLKLLSPGAEPHTVLRIRAKADEAQTVDMTIKLAMGMGGGAAAGEMMKIPAIKLSLSVLPKTVAEGGDINCELRIEDAGLADETGSAPQMVEAMKASLGGVKGMLIMKTISDRGFNKKTELKVAPGTDATARQTMEQMKDSFSNTELLLPEEAVGPGAKWEVKQKIKAQGMTIDQTTTHELVSVDGNTLTVRSSVEQHAANQKVSNPMMPQLKVDLTKMTGSGSAQTTLDLAKVLPVAATTEGHMEMLMSAGAGDQAQTMTMKAGTSVRLESK